MSAPGSGWSNFNPRFPRGKRHHCQVYQLRKLISIHASRGGSDEMQNDAIKADIISIHASRGGSDHAQAHYQGRTPFQSTLPAGEATLYRIQALRARRYFNPRFPRGKRQSGPRCTSSIHNFNPRFPRGKRPMRISTALFRVLNFNPRFPRGKRPINSLRQAFQLQFQSTLPAGEATSSHPAHRRTGLFQSTLPAGEATQ